MANTPLKITQFKGIINKLDPARRPLGALDEAVNIEVDDAEKIVPLPHYQSVLGGSVTDAFAIKDGSRAFLIRNAALVELHEGGAFTEIYSTVGADAVWLEINDTVYFHDKSLVWLTISGAGTRQWGTPVPSMPIVAVDGGGDLPAGQYRVTATYVAPTGREGGAGHSTVVEVADGSRLRISVPGLAGHRTAIYISSTNGEVMYYAYSTDQMVSTWDGSITDLVRPLDSQFLIPPPTAEHAALFRGKVYLSQYRPEADQTIVFVSRPQDYERFNIFEALLITGRVTGLEAIDTGLIIGTNKMIYAYDEQTLTPLAEYGLIESCITQHDEKIFMWTERGLAKGLPYEEMTEDRVSVAPGKAGTAAVLRLNGFERCVVLVEEGNVADNPYER